ILGHGAAASVPVVGPKEPESPDTPAPEQVADGPGAPTADLPDLPGQNSGEEPGREEVAASQPEGEPLVIKVLSGDRQPAAKAEVFCYEIKSWPRGYGQKRDRHWSELAVTDGQRFTADAQGVVRLPVVQRAVLVTARRPGEYGTRMVGRRHKAEELLMLQADQTVQVKVVDADGKGVARVAVGIHQKVPANRWFWGGNGFPIRGRPGGDGLPIGFTLNGASIEFGKGKNAPPRLDLRMVRDTDARGVAVFDHFQLYRRAADKSWSKELHDRFQASVLIPLAEPVAREFGGKPLPAEAIEMRVPALGRLVVRVVDHDGHPFQHAARAELRLVQANVPSWLHHAERRDPAGAGVEFARVGVGLRLRPHVALDDPDFKWDGAEIAGPTAAGQTVVVDVPIGSQFGVLRGRLCDEAGAPLVGLRPTFVIHGKAGRVEGEELTCGPEGMFQLTFARGKHEPPFMLEIRDTKTQPLRGAWVELDDLVVGQTTELGEVKIGPAPLLAHGTVTDDAGTPIARAVIQLQRQFEVGGKNPRLDWRNQPYAMTHSEEDGRYELRGWSPPGSVRLRASAREHFSSESEPFPLGNQVDLRLERFARVSGTLLAPEWLPARAVQIELRSSEKGVRPQRASPRPQRGKPERIFNFGPMHAGYYELVVELIGFPEPMLRVPGIEVRAGQRGPHPSLQSIDITGNLFRFEVVAVDGVGQVLTKVDGPLLARVPKLDGSPGSFVGFPWKGGKVEIVAASSQLEVWQLATGYKVERTTLTHGRSELRFVALPPARLVLQGLRGMVGPDTTVRVSMVLMGDTGLPSGLRVRDQQTGRSRGYSRAQLSKSSGAWLGTDDTVQVPLMREGRYRVVARLRAKSQSVDVVLGTVVVKLEGNPGELRVAVDRGKVQAGLDSLQQRLQKQAEKQAQRQGRR
ncbi:MAG: carboxypeptidase regulatory-like domain-containing protein, partial [Planctomycetes bacterium]|nr:carboxypeptidase regulatory-like domain-containing protein [Planctomycetota bacterium]